MLNIPLMQNNARKPEHLLHADNFNLLVDTLNGLVSQDYPSKGTNTNEIRDTILNFKNKTIIKTNVESESNVAILNINNIFDKILDGNIFYLYIADDIPLDSTSIELNGTSFGVQTINSFINILNNSVVNPKDIKKGMILEVKYDNTTKNMYWLNPITNALSFVVVEGTDTSVVKTISYLTQNEYDELVNNNQLKLDTLYIITDNVNIPTTYSNMLGDITYKFKVRVEKITTDDTLSVTSTGGTISEVQGAGNNVYLVSNDSITSFNITSDNISSIELIYCEDTLTSMKEFCKNLTNLKNIYIHKTWDTKNVSDMSYFLYNSSVESFLGGENLNVSNVTTFESFCVNTRLVQSPNTSTWNTSNVTNFKRFLAYSFDITIPPDTSNWDTSNVTTFDEFLYNTNITIPPDTSNWDTSNVVSFNGFLSVCTSLSIVPNTSNWNTSKVTSFRHFLANTQNANGTLDTSNWDTSNVTDFSYFMYANYKASSTVDTSNWNTSNVTNFSYFLSYCNNDITIDTSNWNTSNVTDFSYFLCWHTSTNAPDTTNWDTSNVENFSFFLANTVNMTETPDTSNWNTSNVTDFSYFMQNNKITVPPDTSNWDTSNVTYLNNFLSNCSELDTSPDVSNWNVSNLVDLSYMLSNTKIKKFKNLNWDTSNVTNFSYFLYNCQHLQCVAKLDTTHTGADKYNLLSNCTVLLRPNSDTLNDLKDDDGAVYTFEDCDNLGFPYDAPINVD